MIAETTYENFVNTLFEEIESELSDLTQLIEIEYYDNPSRCNKLIDFKNNCVDRYEELKSINFEELEGDSPDTCYQCAEISTDIYELIRKLQNNRPH